MTLDYDIALYRKKCAELAALCDALLRDHGPRLAAWQHHRVATVCAEIAGEDERWEEHTNNQSKE